MWSIFAWTPLVTSEMFDPVRNDVLTTVSGVMTIILVIVGFALIVKALK